MAVTLYIVPAWSDQAGQCRIVRFNGKVQDARESYRTNPEAWKEVGLMNSRGKLVCLEGSADMVQELKDCEPLMAGSSFNFEVKGD